MKTLSRKCQYGLRALYLLTREYAHGPVSVSCIAAREQLPRKFLESILTELRTHGFVKSFAGKKGGYRLARKPEMITLGAIIRAMDGPRSLLPCATDTGYRQCSDCVGGERCETCIAMNDVRRAIVSVLDHMTLTDICQRASGGDAALTYEI